MVELKLDSTKLAIDKAVEAANKLVRQAHALLPWDDPVGMVQWIPVIRIQANDWNPNSVANQEMRLLHVSISEDGYCVEESTPILCADLVWRPAGVLQPGDRLIAFDESPVPNESTKHARRFHTAEVTFNEVREDDLWRVVTDRGEVLTNGDHPWLAQHTRGDASQRTLRWIPTRELTQDDLLVHLVEPWEKEDSYESGWLSGFLDGEGTMAQNQTTKKGHAWGLRLSGYQRPSTTADRMVKEMTNRVHAAVYTHVRQNPKWHDMTMVRVDRMKDVMRLLGIVRPERLIEAGGDFWENVSIAQQDSRAKVLSVTREGRGNIASLATSTGTYVAAGFAMHNTQPIVAIFDQSLDEGRGKYVVVDGFHRWTIMRKYADIAERTHGYLPVVVLDKPVADRMASTIRHNRARGKHSVAGMGALVFGMLTAGETDAQICNKLGMEAEELARLKHITGYSKLYAQAEYSPLILTKTQQEAKADWSRDYPDETMPEF